MAEVENNRSISRRGFLKTSAAVGAGAALAGGASLIALGTETAAAAGDEQIFSGVCRPNCTGFCHIDVHVRDGKVVKTTRGSFNCSSDFNRICARGLSHVYNLYDPERLQYPMRRREGTPRGGGEWVRISWDDAFREIAAKIQDVQQKYDPKSVLFVRGSGNEQSLLYRGMYDQLANRLQASWTFGDQDIAINYGKMFAGCGGLDEPQNFKFAKTIVVWSSNLTDTSYYDWHFVKEAMKNGTKLVVVDPLFSVTASKADLWVPTRAGTDAALFLGLMNLAIARGAMDVEFVTQKTVAPFLVKESDGLFLRRSDTGVPPVEGPVNPATGKPAIIDPYMVLQDGQLVAVDEAAFPAIEAEYELDGVKCRTAFLHLKDEIDKWTLSETSRVTQVPEELILELADYCIDKPVSHYCTFGAGAYDNGAHASFAGCVFCALLGNIGIPGGGYGSPTSGFAGGRPGSERMPKVPNPNSDMGSMGWRETVRTGRQTRYDRDLDPRMVYFWGTNPLTSWPSTNAWKEAFDKMECIVVADSMMTETAMYADYVLPSAKYFEYTDLITQGQGKSLSLNEKAVDPPYEVLADSDIVRGLANALNISEDFQLTDEEFLEGCLEGEKIKKMGITWDRLKEEKDFRPESDSIPARAYPNQDGFGTASGRIELYSEMAMKPRYMTPLGEEITPEEARLECIPHFRPPIEAWSENEIAKTYPFHLLGKHSRYRVHSSFFNTQVLREIEPEPTIEVNPEDAQARGLQDGGYAECFNDRGAVVAKVVFNEAVRPGILSYPKGWHRSQFKTNGAWNDLLTPVYERFTVNSSFHEAMCDIRPWSEGSEQ